MLVSFTSLALLEEHPHLYEALKNVKGYRTQEAGSIDDFIQIGKDAKKKAELEKDKIKTEEEIERENIELVEKDNEKKTKKKWYATQIKRLAICMADFVYMTKFREYKKEVVVEKEKPPIWLMRFFPKNP